MAKSAGESHDKGRDRAWERGEVGGREREGKRKGERREREDLASLRSPPGPPALAAHRPSPAAVQYFQ